MLNNYKMKNQFKKYNYHMLKPHDLTTESLNESFELFKELYDANFGSIHEDGNLISIHTGGWSENEYLIEDFKKTWWWFKNHKITASGGHYYFNTDTHSPKYWIITK